MSSNRTKFRRRLCKYRNIISKDFGINLSQCPTKALVICNGGLLNGVDEERVFEKFHHYGQIENIVVIPEKSYCFVLYKEVPAAEAAFTHLNNAEILSSIKSPVFLAFADKIPESLNLKINFNEKPPGLFVLENFISEEEENSLLKFLNYEEKINDEMKSLELKNRRVIHFGYEFNYSNNNVDIAKPIKNIPEEMDFVWDRLLRYSSDLGLTINFTPDQLTINNYQPGQGIPSHVDTHSAFEDPLVSLSLQSTIVMEFKNKDKKCCNVLLPARSLCVMSGEARYGWKHGIISRKSDILTTSDGGLTLQSRRERTSFTFRKIRQKDCSCKFPHFCDTALKKDQGQLSVSALKDEAAIKLEENYVHEVYEKISEHFSETRRKPWPKVVKFVESLPEGAILVDVGCGNGKYFKNNYHNFEIGLDASMCLMEVCKKRGFECFASKCLEIPLRDNTADGCISIAVIHHLATEDRRKRAIAEIIRLLRKKGRALIYVWARNQDMPNNKSSYLKYNSVGIEEKNITLNDVITDLSLPVHVNRTNFSHSDLLVPWNLKRKNSNENLLTKEKQMYFRYYHVFEDRELINLCSNFDNIEIIDYYYDQGNWCIMFEKTN